MLKQPAPTMPGMTDTLDFVKNLWGSMHIPGANMPGMSGLAGPPMSIEDLDKRIADMKAVESWLNLNLSMLHGTIQALEVQRGTLATLRSMSSSMAEALRQSGVSADKMAAMPFASFFSPPAQGAGGKPAAAPAPAPAAAAAQPGAAPSSAQPAAQSAEPAAAPPFDAAGAAAAIGMPAAMAWWNILQEQFTQAVTTAIAPAAQAAAAAPAASAAKPADRPEPAAPSAPSSAAPDGANAAGNGNGNGRARAGRPKADKG